MAKVVDSIHQYPIMFISFVKSRSALCEAILQNAGIGIRALICMLVSKVGLGSVCHVRLDQNTLSVEFFFTLCEMMALFCNFPGKRLLGGWLDVDERWKTQTNHTTRSIRTSGFKCWSVVIV